MKIFQKTRFVIDGKTVKEYKLFDKLVLSKAISTDKREYCILGIKYCIQRDKNRKYKLNYLLFYSTKLIGKLLFSKEINKNKDAKILVCLHLYYMQSWDVIKKYLNNLSCYNYDLIVTYVDNNYDDATLEQVKQFKPNVKLYSYPNKGFDIGSFVDVLQHVDLDKYDIVYKLHSKGIRRNFIFIYNQIFKKRDWFFNLFNGVLGGINVHKTIDKLLNDKNIGIVAADNLIIKDPKHKQYFTHKIAKDIGIKIKDKYQYVAGTCFAIKSKLLKPIKDLNFSIDNFENTERGVFSLAHGMERIVCAVIETQGYEFSGNSVLRNKYSRKTKKLKKLSAIRLLDDDRFKIDYDFFYKRFEMRKIKNYKIEEIRIGDIKRKWFDGKLYNLEDCSPYKYLQGNTECYDEYCIENKSISDFDMSKDKFEKLIKALDTGYDSKYMPIIETNNKIILDGQHRLCYLLNKYGKDYKVEVLSVK